MYALYPGSRGFFSGLLSIAPGRIIFAPAHTADACLRVLKIQFSSEDSFPFGRLKVPNVSPCSPCYAKCFSSEKYKFRANQFRFPIPIRLQSQRKVSIVIEETLVLMQLLLIVMEPGGRRQWNERDTKVLGGEPRKPRRNQQTHRNF